VHLQGKLVVVEFAEDDVVGFVGHCVFSLAPGAGGTDGSSFRVILSQILSRRSNKIVICGP
ncbi:MAG: hypothetical protein V3R90_01780, partial [Limibaculum sp.]